VRWSSWRRPQPAALLVLMAAAGSMGASGGTASSADPIASGLLDLHQGLYARAERSIQSAIDAAPEDPTPRLFLAYARWWQILLADRGEGALDDPFESASQGALAAGERRLQTLPDDARTLAALGAVHILRSHIAAMHHTYFRAAQEARRGKKMLESSLARDPGLTEGLFALGAYNYYADKVPALVKGIRAILFLPGGDAARGLDQLRVVAESTSYFRTDARLLLALICGSREEHCYASALRHLDEALVDNPRSPLILGSIGQIQMRLGRYEEAAQAYEEALRGANGSDLDRQRQRDVLRIALAAARVAGWDLDGASAALAEAERDPGPLPAPARKEGARVRQELSIKRGDRPLDTTGNSLADRGIAESGRPPELKGRPPESLHQALRAAEAGKLEDALRLLRQGTGPGAGFPLARFLRGRVLVLAGRYEEGDEELAAVVESIADPPPWMEGWIEITRGLADKGRGRARAARAHFRRASEVRRFVSSERALAELHADDPERPECAP
jgi:tetratricopeptide (TPR) repeat protein